ncbi:MAG: 30S ribosomal protein S20 [Pirellulales bacterium]|jgi:small subunit ribosomal protein S20|nr:30S ribosomal protein S20 [Pirellulales bacterium]
MPQTKSAKKRFRQDIDRRARNRAGRSKLKTIIKKATVAIEAGQADEAKAAYPLVQKALDQAAAKNLIHRNAAARVKSRLTARIKALGAK